VHWTTGRMTPSLHHDRTNDPVPTSPRPTLFNALDGDDFGFANESELTADALFNRLEDDRVVA